MSCLAEIIPLATTRAHDGNDLRQGRLGLAVNHEWFTAPNTQPNLSELVPHSPMRGVFELPLLASTCKKKKMGGDFDQPLGLILQKSLEILHGFSFFPLV